jgi:hypothetical protein
MSGNILQQIIMSMFIWVYIFKTFAGNFTLSNHADLIKLEVYIFDEFKFLFPDMKSTEKTRYFCVFLIDCYLFLSSKCNFLNLEKCPILCVFNNLV